MAESPMYIVISAILLQSAFSHLLSKNLAQQEEKNMSAIQGRPMGEVFTRGRQLDSAASKQKSTADAESTKYLRIALRLVGVTFIFGIFSLCLVWPSGWSWHTG